LLDTTYLEDCAYNAIKELPLVLHYKLFKLALLDISLLRLQLLVHHAELEQMFVPLQKPHHLV